MDSSQARQRAGSPAGLGVNQLQRKESWLMLVCKQVPWTPDAHAVILL